MSKAQVFLEKFQVNEWLTGDIAAAFSKFRAAAKTQFTDDLRKKFKLDLAKMEVAPTRFTNNRDPQLKDGKMLLLFTLVGTGHSEREHPGVVVYHGGTLFGTYGELDKDLSGIDALKGPDGSVYKIPQNYKMRDIAFKNILNLFHAAYGIDIEANKVDPELLRQRSLQKFGAINLERDKQKQKFDQDGWDRANNPTSWGYDANADKSQFWRTTGSRYTKADKSGYIVNTDKYRNLLRTITAAAGPTKVIEDALAMYDKIAKVIADKAKAIAADLSKAQRLFGTWSDEDLGYRQKEIISELNYLFEEIQKKNLIMADTSIDAEQLKYRTKWIDDSIASYSKRVIDEIKKASNTLKKMGIE